MSYETTELLKIDDYIINYYNKYVQIKFNFCDEKIVLFEGPYVVKDIIGIYKILDGIDSMETHILFTDNSVMVVNVTDEASMCSNPLNPDPPKITRKHYAEREVEKLSVQCKVDKINEYTTVNNDGSIDYAEEKIMKYIIKHDSNVLYSGESSDCDDE